MFPPSRHQANVKQLQGFVFMHSLLYSECVTCEMWLWFIRLCCCWHEEQSAWFTQRHCCHCLVL